MRKVLSVLIMVVMLTAVFAGCGAPQQQSQQQPPSPAEDAIVVGVMVPTSGTEAYYGNDMYQSYQLAVDEINAAGGILGRPVSLYLADDACDANVASQAAAKIIAKDVDFVVGGYASGVTIPTMQQYYDADLLLLISAANSTKITEQKLSNCFMINSPGNHAVVKLAELLKSLDAKKIALVHQGDSYTQDLSDLCEKMLPEDGFEIATVQVMEKGTADVSAIVTAIRNSGADFVYWCGYHDDGSKVIKQLRQGGYEGEIAVGDGSASIELIEACGDAGEGVYVTSPPFVEFAEGGEKFVADYTAKFGMPPGNYATLAYDTMYILKNAVEKVGTLDTKAVRDAVAAIQYKGLSGLIKFTADHEPELSNFIILKINGGKFELIKL